MRKDLVGVIIAWWPSFHLGCRAQSLFLMVLSKTGIACPGIWAPKIGSEDKDGGISFTEAFAASEGGKVIVKCYLFCGAFLLVSCRRSLLRYWNRNFLQRIALVLPGQLCMCPGAVGLKILESLSLHSLQNRWHTASKPPRKFPPPF